jgi:hypothetical protein
VPRNNRRSCRRSQNFIRALLNRNETILSTDKMAADDIQNAAPDAPAGAPNAAPTGESAGKNNGQRGKRGGKGRGNDKPQKRKHTGFGAAKYASHLPSFGTPHADANKLTEATSPTSASRSRTTAMRSAAASSTRTTTGPAT